MTTIRRLLVIDDEPDFAEVVASVGGEMGYSVFHTDSAAEFKRHFAAEPPDVIVLDIVMPKPDGIELMAWLVENGCRARIVICSGYSPSFANAAKVIGEYKGKLTIEVIQKPAKLVDLRKALA